MARCFSSPTATPDRSGGGVRFRAMTGTPHKLTPVREVPLGNIRPAQDNPRTINAKAVEITAASIKRFGWQQPIVVDKYGTILAGHTRYKAAQHLKLKTVPVVVAEHLTDEEAKAYRIADNRTADYTTWDYPELVNQLEGLELDFADELGVDDWRGIIDEFTARAEEGYEDLSKIELGAEQEQLIAEEYRLTVVCVSKEAMNALELELIDRDEVVNVAYTRG